MSKRVSATNIGANPVMATLQSIVDFLPSGVTLFDQDFRMILCNRQFRELLDFPDALFEPELPSMYQLAIFNAERGEYGPGDPADLAAAVIERARLREAHVFERRRPDGRILEIRGNPLPDGGFV
ncbi:MAG TPA: PAS-domain containing protein, partial [Rhodocyclaceae bacterium]|nr:PAS-domain containing protein [Rhodocyclaceae bacterium]